MHDYSIVYGDKVANFATANKAAGAFIEATIMVDQKLNPHDSQICYENITVLGEEIVAYKPGTQYEIRLHGFTHAEWDALTEEHRTPVS